MKRNWEVIREILIRLEELPNTDVGLQLPDFPAEKAYDYAYHMELLIEAGMIEGQMSRSAGAGHAHFFVHRLSWDGHELLDSIRSSTVWEKTKKTFASKGIEMTFDLVKSVATEISVSLLRGI
ncbi:DUF2513 domain-containing protein [Rheinheimera baltica]|uniref:DUF2513 domain-containing protein n=1 Tax=Rheinheimera baltica TaxID=67576 RepID=UPI00273F1D75|nr:DUF2513 domain-containing protein [Rheinheimera baltica]MDP5152069.1 DUF2513 domain-containing protein [Rheinheimera baltica]